MKVILTEDVLKVQRNIDDGNTVQEAYSVLYFFV